MERSWQACLAGLTIQPCVCVMVGMEGLPAMHSTPGSVANPEVVEGRRDLRNATANRASPRVRNFVCTVVQTFRAVSALAKAELNDG